MSKDVKTLEKYRDVIISLNVAKSYMAILIEMLKDLEDRLLHAASEVTKRHINKNSDSIKFGTPSDNIEIDPQTRELAATVNILKDFRDTVEHCVNGVPAKLLTIINEDEDLQKSYLSLLSKNESEKFYTLCEEKGIIAPIDVISKTSKAEKHFELEAWQDMRMLSESSLAPSQTLTDLGKEIEDKIKALPSQSSIEKGFDFS